MLVPEGNPHRTGTNVTVSEKNLIITILNSQASDEHDVSVYGIFHIATRPAALIETGEATLALNSFVDCLLRDLMFHNSSPSGSLAALFSPIGIGFYYHTEPEAVNLRSELPGARQRRVRRHRCAIPRDRGENAKSLGQMQSRWRMSRVMNAARLRSCFQIRVSNAIGTRVNSEAVRAKKVLLLLLLSSCKHDPD
jgi:hypothetical protein